MSVNLKRSDMITGFEFNHLGTDYIVLRFKPGRDTVVVLNPGTNYRGEIPFKIIRRNGRKKENE